MTNQPVRLVAFANGTYSQAASLAKSVPDAQALARLLETHHEYEAFVFPDLDPNGLQTAIGEKLAENALLGGTLILSWTGHGRPGKNNALRLIGNLGAKDIELATAAELGEWAAQTGALQILILIDTCSSGGGLIDAAQLADSVFEQSASRASAWFGVAAASLSDQPALSGALSRELRRLLTDGPRNPDPRWDRKREFIRGDDLLTALRDDWSEPRQTPQVLMKSSRAWDLVRNPLFEPGLPDQVVEHLLQAARGHSGEENYFTGRESALSRIVTWMRKRKPGLLVVTGPPGSGKSAVVGRIVSLSSKEERARILQVAPPPGSLDPGQDSVDAHVQARGITVDTAAEVLLRRLGLDPKDGPFGLLSAAARRRKEGHPLVLVVDGLDEAGAFSRQLAAELLKPLAQECLLVVATREVTAYGQDSLIAILGTAAERVDLGEEGAGSDNDIHRYVIRRLTGLSAAMDPNSVADEIVSSDDAPTSFLLARLVTSQLREKPVDTAAEGWQLTLSLTVESALERDLQSVQIDIDGKPSSTAAREMMRALTLAYGSGFPADDVWPAVATAISETQTKFTREHGYKILATLGRHLVAGSEGDQPVYRVAHQKLVDYLSTGISATARSEAAIAISKLYNEFLDSGLAAGKHQYLNRYGWRHMAEGGAHGLDLLRQIVVRDRGFFLPLLGAGLELASTEAMSAGTVELAIAYLEEALAIWRELKEQARLSIALFQLGMFRLLIGDQQGADLAAQEAASVAQELPESSNQRPVVSAALIGRALTLISEGRAQGAKLLADQALAIVTNTGSSDDSSLWYPRALASLTAGKAAAILNNPSEAIDLCQQAIDLFDQNVESDSDLGITDALATLVSFQLLVAARGATDSAGNLLPASSSAGERLFSAYRKSSKANKVGVVDIGRGLLFAIKSRLLDAERGIDVSHLRLPSLEDLPSRLDSIIDDLIPNAAHWRDAAIILAIALQFRYLWRGEKDLSRSQRDREEAVRILRPFAGKSALVDGTFGEIIDSFINHELAGMSEPTPDVDRLITSQQEAIYYLRRGGPSWVSLLTSALVRLSSLCHMAGRRELQTAAISEAVIAARGLIGTDPRISIQLASMLSDQAALNLEAPLISLPLATEALELVLSIPYAPGLSIFVAFCELNLAASKIALTQPAGAGDLLRDSIQRLEAANAPNEPVIINALATACTNMAMLHLEAGQAQEALVSARRALTLFEESPKSFMISAENVLLARMMEGLALQRTGSATEGDAIAGGVISQLLADLRAGNVLPTRVAGFLNKSGGEVWESTLAGLADRPDLVREMKPFRDRPPKELDLTVATLIEALASTEPLETVRLRGLVRFRRFLDPERFDAAWHKATGDLPSWLQLDMGLMGVMILWADARSLVASRDYLLSHPNLLNPGSDGILEELRLAGEDSGRIDFHLTILSQARELGVAAAYAPFVTEDAVNQWVGSGNLIEYFNEHPELRGADVGAFVDERALQGDLAYGPLAAVLELAKRGELQFAGRIENNPALGFELLRAAWRAQDVTRLAALAWVVWATSNNDASKRRATAILAIARVLAGRNEEARRLMDETGKEAAASERSSILEIIGDAIAHHSGYAAPLASLISLFPGERREAAVT